MISILIIDDHPIVLEGSKLLLQGEEDIEIKTEIDPTNVLYQMQNTHFNVFLVDINMEAKNGITLAAEIKVHQEDALVILYTGEDIQDYFQLIVEKKIDGILSKTATREKVIQTIRSIVQGDLVLPVEFLNFINKRMEKKQDTFKLTNKEKQLLTMLMQGYTNKMIAEELDVTQRTVERYLTQLFTLLDVTSRVQAIEVVKEKNLI